MSRAPVATDTPLDGSTGKNIFWPRMSKWQAPRGAICNEFPYEVAAEDGQICWSKLREMLNSGDVNVVSTKTEQRDSQRH